jgi:hypothetical protein
MDTSRFVFYYRGIVGPWALQADLLFFKTVQKYAKNRGVHNCLKWQELCFAVFFGLGVVCSSKTILLGHQP